MVISWDLIAEKSAEEQKETEPLKKKSETVIGKFQIVRSHPNLQVPE